MNRELLSDLTAASPGADALVAAVRHRSRRRHRLQSLGVASAAAAVLAAAFLSLPSRPRATGTAQVPATSPMLTQNELLDSFGDQPVALVTWPDGRQQLLAIAPPARGR
jgi:hypothetical protein